MERRQFESWQVTSPKGRVTSSKSVGGAVGIGKRVKPADAMLIAPGAGSAQAAAGIAAEAAALEHAAAIEGTPGGLTSGLAGDCREANYQSLLCDQGHVKPGRLPAKECRTFAAAGAVPSFSMPFTQQRPCISLNRRRGISPPLQHRPPPLRPPPQRSQPT